MSRAHGDHLGSLLDQDRREKLAQIGIVIDDDDAEAREPLYGACRRRRDLDEFGRRECEAATPKTSKALYFGFYETPQRLASKARHLGLNLERRIARGDIEVAWQPSTEQSVDALTERLLSALSRTGASRLFVDGLDGFQRATIPSERVHHVFTALANELRTRGVTTIYSYEVPKFIGPDLDAPITGVSALVENLVYLRFVELRSQLYRMLSVLKVRDSEYDTSLREFCITSRGIRLESTFTSAEAILTGSARSIEPVTTADVKKHTAKSKGRRPKRR